LGYILVTLIWLFLVIMIFIIREDTEDKDSRTILAGAALGISLLLIVFLCLYAETKCAEVFYLRCILRDHNIGKFVPDSDTYFLINAEQEVIPNATMAPITTNPVAPTAATGTTP
jgi:hypothetical protein